MLQAKCLMHLIEKLKWYTLKERIKKNQILLHKYKIYIFYISFKKYNIIIIRNDSKIVNFMLNSAVKIHEECSNKKCNIIDPDVINIQEKWYDKLTDKVISCWGDHQCYY